MFFVVSMNPDEALHQGLTLMQRSGIARDSRDGAVCVLMQPVTTAHMKPHHRVIFSRARDANPFFHLFESMWMLAGEQNARWLDRYVKNFSSRYGDEHGNIHGAYGARWNGWFVDMMDDRGHDHMPDQLRVVTDLLRKDPNSRQVVLTMWSPLDDLGTDVRDRPCNTHIYFRVRDLSTGPLLDMTVCCRSNDMIMGAYGANVVHMSILMEYISASIGIPMGIYYQVSNDFHAYERDLQRFGDLNQSIPRFLSAYDSVSPSPLFTTEGSATVRQEIRAWMSSPSRVPYNSRNPQLFYELLVPMSEAHDLVREKKWSDALSVIRHFVGHEDWRIAATEWIERRAK